jgi:hypothetical protein
MGVEFVYGFEFADPWRMVMGSQPNSAAMYSVPPCPSLVASMAAYRRRSFSRKQRYNRVIIRSTLAGYGFISHSAISPERCERNP